MQLVTDEPVLSVLPVKLGGSTGVVAEHLGTPSGPYTVLNPRRRREGQQARIFPRNIQLRLFLLRRVFRWAQEHEGTSSWGTDTNDPTDDMAPATTVEHDQRVHNGAHALWETEVGLDARRHVTDPVLDDAEKDVQDRFEQASESVIDAKGAHPAPSQVKVGPHVAGHKDNG